MNGAKRAFDPSTDMPHVMKLAETIGNVALISIDPVVLTIARTGDGNQTAMFDRGCSRYWISRRA